ncbi:UPF0182 family membrane protein [Nocardioides terrisoli]|uniref:UPF0182 family membrane protein n=1 Tax=Nocardioides terrisoli TaxID=3388267 RepID=UPI00287B8799|nr:UPF0182 family protein [Nocardioides marmorisolisilvae]
MSDFFDDEDAAVAAVRPARRRPRPIVLTLVAIAALLIAFSVFTSIWTEKLWFASLGDSSVFTTLVWTKVALFCGFGVLMALVVGGNLAVAFRLRPMFRPRSPEQAGLDRYREVVTPVRRVLMVAISVVIGLFAGSSAAGQWRDFLMWRHRVPFHKTDPYFHKDIGWYVFSLPWWHFVVDFLMTAVILGLIAAVLVHYLYGGIRLQTPGDRFSRSAQAQVCVLLGVLVLVKAVDYWLDRYDLTTNDGSLITGMTYARQHAVLPAKDILMAIALICAVLFFANVWRHTWLLPGVGIALFALSAVLLGLIWPAVVEKFQVKPNEPDKESTYIAHNIAATRAAYDLDGTSVTEYDAKTTLSPQQSNRDAASLPGIRLVDPMLVSETFQQLQQVRGYYSVPSVLDVDHYEVDGRERDMVVAAREMHLAGLPGAEQKWSNEHTVYTHGYGIIAAYGNQRNAQDKPVRNDGSPVWAERDIPPKGVLGKYRPQIYFGENSPDYSVVGKAPGGHDVELDSPQGTGDSGRSTTTTYAGKGGVPIGSLFHKLLYAAKFGDSNLLLSSRVHAASKILYDRSPRERLQKVAPWLTVDSDALPAVVDGRIVWILDGYTVSDRYADSESRSMEEMTSDAINPRSTYATLPTDQINYIRNSVKATVDAYDGTVTLYAWDQSDPILQAMEKAFPHLVKPRSDIPPDLLAHMRYPEDLFKVQRNILADYHVTDPTTFFNDNDRWDVPNDPSSATRLQPPYRLSVATKSGGKPVFSLTSVYTPKNKQNLASFISVGADPEDPSTYGKFQILRLPDNTQVPGPSQIANQFASDDHIANRLQAFKRVGAKIEYGNLLTLPVGGGLLYVQPVYTSRAGGTGNYPALRFVLVSFGKEVGIGDTLSAALDDVLGVTESDQGKGGSTKTAHPRGKGGTTTKGNGGKGGAALPEHALRLLQRADAKFRQGQDLLRQGDLAGYAKAVRQGERLVQQAIAAGSR